MEDSRRRGKQLSEVTRGYEGLRGVTRGYEKLRGVTKGYEGLHESRSMGRGGIKNRTSIRKIEDPAEAQLLCGNDLRSSRKKTPNVQQMKVPKVPKVRSA